MVKLYESPFDNALLFLTGNIETVFLYTFDQSFFMTFSVVKNILIVKNNFNV